MEVYLHSRARQNITRLLQSNCLYINFYRQHIFKESSLNRYTFRREKITHYLMNSFSHTDFNSNALLKPFYKYFKEFTLEQTSKGHII